MAIEPRNKESTAGESRSPTRGAVYIVGAGFSAGLRYPLVHDLLIRLWERLPSADREQLTKVIQFHHPGFDPDWRTSFPTIEHLLSEMMANEQLFDASRSAPGKFTLDKLRTIRRDLLLSIAEWFHEIHANTFRSLPSWLEGFRDHVLKPEDTIISFNWDLVLDQLLFGEEVKVDSYGFKRLPTASVRLLKPHGSLNWYDGQQGAKIKDYLRFLLHEETDQKVYVFKHFRSPRSKNKYMPMIIPPVYNKDFGQHLFRDLWRECVASLSSASNVVFLGYSLAEADLHARFIIRCGFHNQVEGEVLRGGKRSKPTGKSDVVIVNPDQGAASRIERCVGSHIRCDWQPIPVAEWVRHQTTRGSVAEAHFGSDRKETASHRGDGGGDEEILLPLSEPQQDGSSSTPSASTRPASAAAKSSESTARR